MHRIVVFVLGSQNNYVIYFLSAGVSQTRSHGAMFVERVQPHQQVRAAPPPATTSVPPTLG